MADLVFSRSQCPQFTSPAQSIGLLGLLCNWEVEKSECHPLVQFLPVSGVYLERSSIVLGELGRLQWRMGSPQGRTGSGTFLLAAGSVGVGASRGF